MEKKRIFYAQVIVVMIVLTMAVGYAQESTGSYSGSLSVQPSDDGLVISGKSNPAKGCGDGILQAYLGEQCDENDFGGVTTCEALYSDQYSTENYDITGTLSCTNTCTYDTNQCTITPKEQDTGASGDNNAGGGGGGSSGGGGGGSGLAPPPSNVDGGICVESWECEEWSTCNDEGISTRTCTDKNNCGTTDIKPEVTVECGDEETSPGITGATVGKSSNTVFYAVIVLIVLLAIVAIRALIVRNK